MVCRCKQLDLTNVFQPALQKNFLRRRVTWVGISADRFQAEGSEPVIDHGRGRFPGVSVSPIRLAQPITERRLVVTVASATVKPHAADQAVGFLQRDCEPARLAGRVILLYASDPLAPIDFAIGVRYCTRPARDFRQLWT